MDSSPGSPDADSSVFSSLETSAEPVKTETIRTSVSVSSLAEKFEKAGDSVKNEEKVTEGEISEWQMERKEPANASNVAGKSDMSESGLADKEKFSTDPASQQCAKTNDAGNSGMKNENSDQTRSLDDNLSSKDMDGVSPAAKDMSDSRDVPQPSASAADVNSKKTNISNETEAQISNAVEERVAYFAEKISQSLQNSATSSATKEKSEVSQSFEGESGKMSVSSEHYAKYGNVASQISLKDLEQSFVTALNLVSVAGEKKTTDTAAVPSIRITEASDQEETNMEIVEETISETEINVANKMIDTKTTDVNVGDPTGTDVPTVKSESEVSSEERKAVFYLTSSDSQPPQLIETVQSSEEMQPQAENLESVQPIRSQQSESRTHRSRQRGSSCLNSKSFHGAMFLASFVIGMFGYVLYCMAHDGKLPDFCQTLGLITAMTAGVVGSFSCFSLRILGAFPINNYERLLDRRNNPSANGNINSNVQNVDEESRSPEAELAFRRQNGISSSTSETNLRSRHSDPRELIEKTEKLKKDVVGLLDSFSELMAKLDPVDEVSDMESGIAHKVKPSSGDVNTAK